jgi:hypothetical protein
VLGVACHKHPPRVVSRTLEVAHGGQALTPHRFTLILDGEQGNDGAGKAQQVVLTKLREDLVGSRLQSVIEVVACSHGEPGRHARVGGVCRDVHMDLAASMPELMVWAAMVRGSPRVAETVQHVLEQGRKAGTVQPIAMKLSVGPKGGVGVVIHLLKTREKRINISSIERRQQTKTQNKPPR